MYDRLGSEQGGPHGLPSQLFVWGLARLMGGLAVLVPSILSLGWFGVEVGPALLVGGLVGLGSVLLQPGTLGRPVARLLGASQGPIKNNSTNRSRVLGNVACWSSRRSHSSRGLSRICC